MGRRVKKLQTEKPPHLITPEVYELQMRCIADSHKYDRMSGHLQADQLNLIVLSQLGYEKGTKIFKEMEKFYG